MKLNPGGFFSSFIAISSLYTMYHVHLNRMRCSGVVMKPSCKFSSLFVLRLAYLTSVFFSRLLNYDIPIIACVVIVFVQLSTYDERPIFVSYSFPIFPSEYSGIWVERRILADIDTRTPTAAHTHNRIHFCNY